MEAKACDVCYESILPGAECEFSINLVFGESYYYTFDICGNCFSKKHDIRRMFFEAVEHQNIPCANEHAENYFSEALDGDNNVTAT